MLVPLLRRWVPEPSSRRPFEGVIPSPSHAYTRARPHRRALVVRTQALDEGRNRLERHTDVARILPPLRRRRDERRGENDWAKVDLARAVPARRARRAGIKRSEPIDDSPSAQ